jgi:cold shock CspA family protein
MKKSEGLFSPGPFSVPENRMSSVKEATMPSTEEIEKVQSGARERARGPVQGEDREAHLTPTPMLQLTFLNFRHSEAIARRIQSEATNLARFYPRITAIRVWVELLSRKRHQGNRFRLKVGVFLPRRQIMVSRNPGISGAYEDVYVAIRDGFQAARRRLEDMERKRRIRVHNPVVSRAQYGQIRTLYRESPHTGYGFLRAQDGRDIYFQSESLVKGSYDALRIGDWVRFSEEAGDQGPQASSVVRISSHTFKTD